MNPSHLKVAVTDWTFPDLSVEEAILKPHGIEVVAHQCQTETELIELCADADAVITQFARVNANVVSAMQKARAIVRYGIGVDNVDLDKARERNIPVCNVPDYCIDEVADQTLAFILATTRQIVTHATHLRAGKWGLATPLTGMKALRDLTVGVVGFGRIGREVVRRLIPFKCAVQVFDPVVPATEMEKLGAKAVTFDGLLKNADVLTLHCPSTPQTRKLMNRETFAKLKPGAIFINVGRGDLADPDALTAALQSGHLGAAALDVFDPEPIPESHPIRTMPNIILAPHIASCSVPAVKKLRESVANLALAAVRGEPLLTIVNHRERSETMTATGTATAVSFDALHALTLNAFVVAGLSETDATIGADALATTDAWGMFTHGTKCLAGYLRRMQAGGLRPRGVPRVVAEGGAWATVDGDSALGQVTSVFAMQTAIAKARQQGIAYVGVRNSCHFGAAGYYTWLAAREGLIGISMANDIPSVAAPGSRGAITGSNPISYAIPAGRHPPMLLDMSTATVAGGKVYAARMRGEPIPDTWLVGADGKPTTDPSGYPQVGALQPAAGHKGYGLSLLIETLSGILSGAAFTWRVGNWMWDDGDQPTNHGAAFIVIDTNAIMPAAQFASRMEALIDEIHAAPVVEGGRTLRVPGEMEWEHRSAAVKNGIALPEDVVTNLRKAAAMTGLSPDWLK